MNLFTLSDPNYLPNIFLSIVPELWIALPINVSRFFKFTIAFFKKCFILWCNSTHGVKELRFFYMTTFWDTAQSKATYQLYVLPPSLGLWVNRAWRIEQRCGSKADEVELRSDQWKRRWGLGETSVYLNDTTRRNIPEVSDLHIGRRENLNITQIFRFPFYVCFIIALFAFSHIIKFS
jgi:hypothetical protein